MEIDNLASTSRDRFRAGFINLVRQDWTAGGQYLKNVFMALEMLPESERPEVILVIQTGTTPSDYALFTPYLKRVIEIPGSTWERYMKSLYLRLPLPRWLEMSLVTHSRLISTLNNYQVDGLFSNDEYGPGFPIPLVSWIPDFQHKHLSHLFSRSKARTVDRHNQRIAAYAQRILLSSQNALRDFASCSPTAVGKARVVHFVAQPPQDVYNQNPAEICRQYNLPERFIYLPNQFWRHKNHQAVIDALVILKASHPEIVIACTGSTYEYRDPGYFNELMEQVQTYGLAEQFRYLGIIPHPHIYLLMRQCLAVLQPSWFEGWSTTVEEAKSIGKGLILSDIPVHREQNPPGSIFFDPGKPESLADCLVNAHQEKKPGPDWILEENARQALPGRTQEFGLAFLDVLRQATSAKR